MKGDSRPAHSVLGTTEYRRLLAIIRRVRQRWRLKLLLRGAAALALAGLVALAGAALALEWLRYRPVAAWGAALASWLSIGFVGYRFLLRPLARRVTDRQVALYVEEHVPGLEGALLSAVEFGGEAEGGSSVSPGFIERVIEQALDGGRRIDFGRAVEAPELRRVSGYLGAASMAVLATLLLSPAPLRHALPFLLSPWGDTPARVPYGISVTPGNAQVARGGEQEIRARLTGFDADAVRISYRVGDGAWQDAPMLTEGEGYVFRLFDVADTTEYLVAAAGVRSEVYRIEVVDLPWVERVDLELRFPDYTRLAPETIEDGGDVAALPGTRVRVSITPTVPVPGGRLLIFDHDPARSADGDGDRRDDSGERGDRDRASRTVPLAQVGQRLEGRFVVRRSGGWRVELDDFDGRSHRASATYRIDVLRDQTPVVKIDRPGRDVSATPVEELFIEASAEDDFGVGRVELVWSINDGPERTQPLFAPGGGDAPRATSASYTLYLEEYELEPGDLIAYYARAADTRRPEAQVVASDIYFVTLRPFRRDYRQAAAGGGAGGGAADSNLQLVQRQRELVAATFRLVRDREVMDPARRDLDLDLLAGLQGQLRESTLEAVGSLQSGRAGTLDAVENLRAAAAAMQEASTRLGQHDPAAALPQERAALHQLQRAEALVRELMLAFAQGGGGEGGQLDQEALAEMLDFDQQQLRNQYETVQRRRRERADNEIDEALQRLTELARRQQQEIERRRAQGGQPPNQGGGSQRGIADQAEELARRLERLSRERSRADLQAAANRLQEAADAMRRAAADRGETGLGEGARALSELQRARRLLDRERRGRLQRDLADARERLERMRAAQARIQREVERLGAPDGRDARRLRELLERKDALAAEIDELEASLDGMGRAAREQQPASSRELQRAAEWIRDAKLSDKVRYSKGVVQERDEAYARRFEQGIDEDLARLQERLADAERLLETRPDERLAEQLERARDLARRLEALEDRLRRGQRSEADGGNSGENSSGDAGTQGERDGDRQADSSSEADAARGGVGGAADGPPGPRQLRREFRERLADAERLRDALQQEGVQVSDLEGVIAAMRDFEQGFSGTTRGLDRLRSQVIDALKRFELRLRRAVDAANGRRPQLADSDQVPEGYRELVEEYFRALARGPGE